MTRRYFWQVPDFIKFRTVFENADTVIGVNDNNEHRLFRKDTGCINFDERAALNQRLASLAERVSDEIRVRYVPRMHPEPACYTH